MIFKKVELAKIERDAPEAYQSLAKFYQTHGTASFYFLCHVALPLFFRLDWLHHLWANFRGDIAQKIRQDVPYHTIADVLQTPFLATVGKETYELENTVRDFLLSELESEFGEAHLHKLATFLYQYADKCVPKGYEQEAYHLSAWSVKNPQEATRIVADSLQNLFNKPNPATDHAEHTRLLFVLQSIASPAQDKTPYNAIEKIAQRNYDLLNEEASQQKYPIVTQQQAGKNTIEFKVPHNILEGLKIQDRATPENENIIPEAIQMIEKMFGAMEEVSIESIGDKKNKGAYSINEKGEVIALALREKGIKEIDFLSHFPHVEKLYLSENKIRDIVPLESLVNLTYLGLKDNLVMDVTPIQSLSNLVHLGLKDNKITYIPPDFLTYLPRLEQLFLTGNDIANIPITINLMKSNVLDVLKKHFDSLRNKRKKIIIEKEKKAERANMDAQSNNLDDYFQQASQSFGGNNNNVVLEEPTAYKSDFLPIDFEGKDEIVLPPYTQNLNLSGILIDESIVELSQLPNLTYLKLSGMELTDLSFLTALQERETKFEYLEILDLSNNALTSFPAHYLDLMPNLKELYLFGNVLPELPEEVVRVEGNCLAYFKPDAKKLFKEAKEKALLHLEDKNYGNYFKELDKIKIPKKYLFECFMLKNQYAMGYKIETKAYFYTLIDFVNKLSNVFSNEQDPVYEYHTKNHIIEKSLECLERSDFVAYFSKIEKIAKDDEQTNRYNELKMDFMKNPEKDNFDWLAYYDSLANYAIEIDSTYLTWGAETEENDIFLKIVEYIYRAEFDSYFAEIRKIPLNKEQQELLLSFKRFYEAIKSEANKNNVYPTLPFWTYQQVIIFTEYVFYPTTMKFD